MTAPSIGAKDLLVSKSVGTFNSPPSGAWPIYISEYPDDPSEVVAIFDSGGHEPDPKWLLEYPNLNILIRSDNYQDLYSKMRDIRSVLLGLTSQTINGDRWDSVRQVGEAAYLGRDNKNRPSFSLTFKLIIEPAVNGSLDNRQPL